MPSRKTTTTKSPLTDRSLRKTIKKPKHKFKFRVARGARSNFFLNKIVSGETLSDDDVSELRLRITGKHRIDPVKKKIKTATVFDNQTGHHEWIPTDQAPRIIAAKDLVWSGLYSTLRSPTWLLIISPSKFCMSSDNYAKAIRTAAACHRENAGRKVNASQLGLVGHSGGLNFRGTQLTTHQSNWHDELRALFTQNLDARSYGAYFSALQRFIDDSFLFVENTNLPIAGTGVTDVSAADVMKSIAWDLQLSGRGNPTIPGADMSNLTLYDIATFLSSEWSTWRAYLVNSFNGWRFFC